MEEESPLDLYTAAGRRLYEFREKNEPVLTEFDTIISDLHVAEMALKEYAREQKKNISNEYVRVTFSPTFKRWYDAGVVIGSKLKKVVIDKVIKKEVDKATFEALVEAGEIPNDLKVEAYREQEQTPKIFIKENYNEQKATEAE